AAVAGVALLPGRNADLRFLAERSFLQRDFHRVRQVAAAVDLAPGAAAAAALLAEDVAEDVAESLREAAETLRAGAACSAHVRIHAGMAELVISRTLVGVRQHFVRFLGFLELGLRPL